MTWASPPQRPGDQLEPLGKQRSLRNEQNTRDDTHAVASGKTDQRQAPISRGRVPAATA